MAFRTTGSTPPKIFRREVTEAPLLISSGTIRDASGTWLDHDILVESFQISRVAPEINTEAMVFDASGTLVIPGLVHPWLDPGRSTTLELAKTLRELLLQGVTTVHVPRISLEQGHALRQAIAEHLVEGPRLLLSVSLNEARSNGPLLTNLRRALGFGADLVVIDSDDPTDIAVAKEAAADLKRLSIEERVLRTASLAFSRLIDADLATLNLQASLEDLDLVTMDPATTIGLGESIGSVAVGKLAELVVLAPVSQEHLSQLRPTAILTTAANPPLHP